MKRNSSNSRNARRKKAYKAGTIGQNSKYARKVRAGNMMYGDGRTCCGHPKNKGTEVKS